jgi:hypothetical protein
MATFKPSFYKSPLPANYIHSRVLKWICWTAMTEVLSQHTCPSSENESDDGSVVLSYFTFIQQQNCKVSFKALGGEADVWDGLEGILSIGIFRI